MAQSQALMLEQCADSMNSAAARDLLRYLCRYGGTLKHYSFVLRDKGYLRTARYERDGKCPFAFIVNRANVLFYIRKVGMSHPAANIEHLRMHFLDAKVNNRGEIQFHVTTEIEAHFLMKQLFE